MSWRWILNKRQCTGCGICSDICPERAINQSSGMAYPEPISGKCTGCLDCVDECPGAAITVEQVENSAGKQMPEAS